jgi:hypothetical protein
MGLPFLLDPGNILIAQRHRNVEIGAEAVQFPEKEHITGIAVAVYTSCHVDTYQGHILAFL